MVFDEYCPFHVMVQFCASEVKTSLRIWVCISVWFVLSVIILTRPSTYYSTSHFSFTSFYDIPRCDFLHIYLAELLGIQEFLLKCCSCLPLTSHFSYFSGSVIKMLALFPVFHISPILYFLSAFLLWLPFGYFLTCFTLH